MKKITILLGLLAIVLLVASSCAPSVSQEEYDRLSQELSAAQGQVASLQSKLVEAELLKPKNEELSRQYNAVKSDYDKLQSEYEGLGKKIEDSNRQLDTARNDYNKLQAEYRELTTEYGDLKKEYDASKEKVVEVITETGIEQAIFRLVNIERKDNGLDELAWGDNLYKWALANNREMAKTQGTGYADYGAYQQVFWAAGYDRTESIANAALTIWKNEPQFDKIFLNPVMKYATASAYKEGDIYYITFISDYFK